MQNGNSRALLPSPGSTLAASLRRDSVGGFSIGPA